MDNIKEAKIIATLLLELPLEECGFGPVVVQHPYFESGFAILNENGEYKSVNMLENEEAFILKKEEFQKRINKANTVFDLSVLIRKSYRLTFLKFVEPYLSCETFSELLAEIWVTSENPNQDANCNTDLLNEFFQKADKNVLMNEEELKVYNALPEEFIIYRGVAVGRNPDGLSWTRNREKAQWFANRFDTEDEKGYLKAIIGKKENVLAYFNTRDEDEIVYFVK